MTGCEPTGYAVAAYQTLSEVRAGFLRSESLPATLEHLSAQVAGFDLVYNTDRPNQAQRLTGRRSINARRLTGESF
ncbi:hypothetical protein [Microbacterium sp.]|uniref:hypothetical protein n=1 Tax=Microbacterium sp. TaxID=51671 RepID=UPI003A8DA45F